jgi:sugar lactone lactonase YvrE
MKRLFFFFFLLTPLFTKAQLLVYTVAGSDTAHHLGDGGLATNALMGSTEGVWMDGSCNLYFTDLGDLSIRKVNLKTGIITTVAGTNNGFSGDGGPATNAQIIPYGLFVDSVGNIYIADAGNNRVRKVDVATGIINTIAGGGSTLGDGGPATDAQLNDPANVYADNIGNIYIAENGGNRIRKINITGIITTIAGIGTEGLSGDGGPATNAQLYGPSGMLMDASGNLLFSERGNSRIRKINLTTGIITTVAGKNASGIGGYTGDGSPATAALLGGPISFVIDKYGNIVIGDNGNNVIRKVDAVTGIITTIAGVGNNIIGSSAEGAPALTADIHPEFMYLDIEGTIYYSCYCNQIRKIINYNPGLGAYKSICYPVEVPQVLLENNIDISPNPTNNLLQINNLKTTSTYRLLNIVGAVVQQGELREGNNSIFIQWLPEGMYMLEVMDNVGQRVVKKVVKE